MVLREACYDVLFLFPLPCFFSSSYSYPSFPLSWSLRDIPSSFLFFLPLYLLFYHVFDLFVLFHDSSSYFHSCLYLLILVYSYYCYIIFIRVCEGRPVDVT